ncbi:MAG TPA: Xaa-Pro peptidase family protein [bacterium]|nr:Xaa-Pro peptidase family protein [bacterium]
MGYLSRNVFQDRLARIRQALEAADLAALVVLTPENFLYVSGHFLDVQPWERPVAAVVPREDSPFLVMHELSSNHVRYAAEHASMWISEVHFYAEHYRMQRRTWMTPQWPQMVADLLRRKGLARGRVGVDSAAGPIAAVPALLPELQLANAGRILREMRMVKGEEELTLIRQGAELSDWGQARYREYLEPGRPLAEIDTLVLHEMAGEAARRFRDYKVELRVSGLTGPNSACPHGISGDYGQVVEQGHGLVNIIIPRLNGYVCENERTFFVGSPSKEQATAFEAAVEAQAAAAAALVSGATMADVDAAAQRVFERCGFADRIIHRTGHGIGLAGHEYPDDIAFNYRPLLEHEVFSCEPGIYLYGVGGFRHDDTVIVKKGSAEITTKFPRDLESQTVPVKGGGSR